MRLVISAMFRIVLPFATRLPLRMGLWVAKALGQLCYWLDLDWRTVALRKHYVALQTRQAFAEVNPDASAKAIASQVRQRFLSASKDELEAYWLHADRARESSCEFEGLEPVQHHLRNGQGLVLATIHYDAALMGVAQLGLAGIKLNLMTSEVIEDPRLPESVRLYFRRKRAGVQAHLNGGEVLNVETRLKRCYDAIKRGEGVVIFAEAPTAQLDGAKNIQFLGKRRAVAPGAFRIAERTGCAMAAFVCLCLGPGRYRLLFTPVYQADPQNGHAHNADAMFDFFSRHIRNAPGLWWAADQLPNFINLSADQP